MKLFAVHPVVWSILMVLWTSKCETEGNNPDVCQEDISIDELHILSSSGHEDDVEKTDVNETFSCHLYPNRSLSCSWSFHTLQKDAQLSVHISVCDQKTTADSRNSSSKEEVGLQWILKEQFTLPVILQFNMSLHDKWTFYTYVYYMEMLEVLSPPSNISALVIDNYLVVQWDLPGSRTTKSPSCFEYQLDLGDQEEPKTLTNERFYKELNDPTRTYRVKIRAKKTNECFESPMWSDWSPTVTVQQSAYKLNTLVIISISLGIPMILLAVLLLVRHQRVSELLFPPIPCPPPKYIYFLEKNEPSNFFHLAQPDKTEEEIMEVEDAKENAGKSL